MTQTETVVLIQFHKDCLASYRHLLNPAAEYLVQQTIKALEELERIQEKER